MARSLEQYSDAQLQHELNLRRKRRKDAALDHFVYYFRTKLPNDPHNTKVAKHEREHAETIILTELMKRFQVEIEDINVLSGDYSTYFFLKSEGSAASAVATLSGRTKDGQAVERIS